jgi:hypothetical protein
MATTFPFTSGDGTRVIGWRNDGTGVPAVISNGLGTPPSAWPTVTAADSGFRVATWYYRGTGGGDHPQDPSRVRIEDRVAGLMAVAGVPGGTFRAMFGPLGVPKRFRHDVGVTAARLGRRIGPQLSWVSRRIPLNQATARVINHSGFVLPRAAPTMHRWTWPSSMCRSPWSPDGTTS